MERAGQGSLVGIMIMMQKVIRSEKQGQDFYHYDSRGHKTGHSDRNLLGDWNHYDD